MLFNSIQFFLFFVLVFGFYWFIRYKSVKIQNLFLVLASYFFYACWDWRFLLVLFFSTLWSYFSGTIIQSQSGEKRKYIFTVSICISLGVLWFFKYYGFFVESFADLLKMIGFKPHLSTLRIILPIGISFYTLQSLAYVSDVYKGKIKACTNYIDYSLFISFFPLLLAGPIERAKHLLPQIEQKRIFKYSRAVDGFKQILWGLFKKVVVADSCAPIIDNIFANYTDYSGSTLSFGSILYSVQIYADFSGYTDIALGCARLLGFELYQNFRFPYFSKNVAEFWRRWHISFSAWLKDYLYIPLGGNREGLAKTIRNIFIVFLVSGLWHGANWTYVFWGGLHAIFMLPLIILRASKEKIEHTSERNILSNVKVFSQILITFLLCSFARIFFRAESLNVAFHYVGRMFSGSLVHKPDLISILVLVIVLFFFVIEWLGRHGRYGLDTIGERWNRPFRWLFYYFLLLCIFYFSSNSEQRFIYFQF